MNFYYSSKPLAISQQHKNVILVTTVDNKTRSSSHFTRYLYHVYIFKRLRIDSVASETGLSYTLFDSLLFLIKMLPTFGNVAKYRRAFYILRHSHYMALNKAIIMPYYYTIASRKNVSRAT